MLYTIRRGGLFTCPWGVGGVRFRGLRPRFGVRDSGFTALGLEVWGLGRTLGLPAVVGKLTAQVVVHGQLVQK